jgi:hypothetical protein
MKRFNPSELCINIYDEPKDPQQPLPKDYGISYRLIEEYEQRIEAIENKYPDYYSPTNDIAKGTFALLFVIALCYAFSGFEHSASYLIFPAVLIPFACVLNWYLKEQNHKKRELALKSVRSEIIEKYLKDLYDWYNKTHEYKHQYYDIV